MNEIELRVPANLCPKLLEGISVAKRNESVAFGLVSDAALGGRRLLLLKNLVVLPDDAYLAPQGHGARWSGRFTIEVLNRALREDCGVVILHEHTLGNPVRLSGDDITSGTEQLEIFARVHPGRPHGTAVVGRSTAAGLFHVDGVLGRPPRFTLKLLSSWIDKRPSHPVVPAATTEEAFARQVLVIEGLGQARLASTTVAVVGLGGGGSHVVQQLAHLGVGRIYGIDRDLAEASNRSRMIGLTSAAVEEHRAKTAVAADVVSRIGLGTAFVPVQEEVPSPAAIAAIKEADIIVGCVDNYHARADLQALAWRFLIPYVDIGLTIDPGLRSNHATEESWIGGNVHTLMPGSMCLWCSDYLTEERLNAETDGRGRSYMRGGGAAQVVSFNGVLASQAVNEVLQIVTGFSSRAPGSRLLKFNGVRGTLEHWQTQPRLACQACRYNLGAGDARWKSVDSRNP